MVKAYTDRYKVLELGGISVARKETNKRTGSGDLGEKGREVREERGMQNGLAVWPMLLGFLLTRHTTEIATGDSLQKCGFLDQRRTFFGRVCRGSDVAWAASLITLLLSGRGR